MNKALPYQNHNSTRNRDVRRVPTGAAYIQPSRYINSSLLIITLIMVCFGLVMLFSASMSDSYSQAGNSMYYVLRQAGITAVGLVFALVLALVMPVRFFDKGIFVLLLYALTTGLLVYVKVNGVIINGARRWVQLGIMFQPSELAKIAIVFCFAGYISLIRRMRRRGRLKFRSSLLQFVLDGWLDILLPGAAMLIWIGLVAWQPHISGAAILGFVGFVVLLAAGIPLRTWLSAASQLLVFLVIAVLLISMLLPALTTSSLENMLAENFEHVSRRLDTFLNPESASEDSVYQINQSIIAIGSGGLNGLGLGEGRQKYNYLPEAHNDFVFAIIGEELGFIGCLSVILLFILFMLIGISIAFKAANVFSATLAAGFTMLISIQALLNIGVATQTLPSTGISLPFFSYGGTSNFFFLMAIGFILCVSRTGSKRNISAPTAEIIPVSDKSSTVKPRNLKESYYG